MTKFGRLLPVALLAVACLGQVAEEANRRYQTRESRRRMAQVLDGADRDERQKPRELVAAMELKPGMTVVDFGTGVGYMLPFLSQAVGPTGKVLAQDIHRDFVARAREKAKTLNLTNIEFVLGTETEANLAPKCADAIVALDAYHHFNYPERMLAGIRKALKPEGRLFVVDYYKQYFRDPDHVRLEDVDAIKEIEANGFRLVSRKDHIPESQYLLVLKKR